jgi:nucleoid DNA-binding protein
MTKSQLVQKLAEATELSKKQADAVLQKLVDLTVGSVRKGDPVKIPARKKVRFSVAKTFKESVLGKK